MPRQPQPHIESQLAMSGRRAGRNGGRRHDDAVTERTCVFSEGCGGPVTVGTLEKYGDQPLS